MHKKDTFYCVAKSNKADHLRINRSKTKHFEEKILSKNGAANLAGIIHYFFKWFANISTKEKGLSNHKQIKFSSKKHLILLGITC